MSLLPALPRPSFRQLLLVAFLLQAALMGAVAWRGQTALERLLERSRASAERMQTLAAHAERLAEQGLTMERAARQYLVLGDPVLRSTFERANEDAAGHVEVLVQAALPAALVQAWQQQREAIARQLVPLSPAAAALRDPGLTRDFRELHTLHNQMAEQVRLHSEARYAELQAEVEAGRQAVGRQLVATLVLSAVLALALALWLARPLRRVEAAILLLGDNRLDERIEIRGPADVRQLGRRLDWLRQRLSGLDADKARFLRHVSHELKTPLAALREGVALLQDGVAGPLSDDQREVARILRDNTAALQHRIEDLLRFNAAAFAAARLVRKPTDVRALVQGLITEQQLQWRGRGLQVHLQPAASARGDRADRGEALMADVDATLLRSAVGNLLSNAIRYSPAGASIHIELARVGDGLHIVVADQGPGVAAADRDRIFEPFYRGRPPPDEGGLPGSGIGLSIVAETVAAHGGTISLLPSDPPGARFRIELPHALAD